MLAEKLLEKTASLWIFCSSKRFCKRWAELESREVEFEERTESCWKREERWEVTLWDLWRWDGDRCCWNGWDVGSGRGRTLRAAWEDLERKILEYEKAGSREGAMLRAQLRRRAELEERGWGERQWKAHYWQRLG